MSFVITCDACKTRIRVTEKPVGTQASCPKCSTSFLVPAPPAGTCEEPAPTSFGLDAWVAAAMAEEQVTGSTDIQTPPPVSLPQPTQTSLQTHVSTALHNPYFLAGAGAALAVYAFVAMYIVLDARRRDAEVRVANETVTENIEKVKVLLKNGHLDKAVDLLAGTLKTKHATQVGDARDMLRKLTADRERWELERIEHLRADGHPQEAERVLFQGLRDGNIASTKKTEGLLKAIQTDEYLQDAEAAIAKGKLRTAKALVTACLSSNGTEHTWRVKQLANDLVMVLTESVLRQRVATLSDADLKLLASGADPVGGFEPPTTKSLQPFYIDGLKRAIATVQEERRRAKQAEADRVASVLAHAAKDVAAARDKALSAWTPSAETARLLALVEKAAGETDEKRLQQLLWAAIESEWDFEGSQQLYYIRAVCNKVRKGSTREALAMVEFNKGLACTRDKDYGSALTHYVAAMKHDPNYVWPFNNAAWLLATCPDGRIRDGRRAVDYALVTCRLSKWSHWSFKDTLAAAYAASGDFEQAVKYQTQAVETVPTNRREETQGRLHLYRMRQSYRDE